ncbi:MAG TPA: glycoside hydrolase family 15 protein [Terriglobales bacterium]|nr:glycoside hydrolase family 15 protein [Terriglobales bacterium]
MDKASIPDIHDYGIIGDCRAAALISRDGSIDWLCWPRFDKPAIFAALLDREKGGQWRISPAGPAKHERRYLPDSNVLESTFVSESGSAVLMDAMPISSEFVRQELLFPDHEILRRLECTDGEIQVDVAFVPRADYGLKTLPIRNIGKLGMRMESHGGVYWLRGTVPLELHDGGAYARINLRAGDAVQFSLSYEEEGPAVLPPIDRATVQERIDSAIKWWQGWARQADYDGAYRNEVVRSALTLKLMSFAPSGAIIAAPTTSLPERLGADLNWDYRFCWLRDASLTIRALLELGYWEEAGGFLDWMLHATRITQPELLVLYTVYGDYPPDERTLDYLSGYRNSQPVRIGNAARDQLQMDVYGEVIDAAAQYAFHGGHLDREMQKVLIGFGNYVLKHWHLPDEGIWEPRDARVHHTHSRLMCWTALDRLVSLHKKGQLRGAPVEEYKRVAELIRHQIHQRGWNAQMRSYVSVLDSDDLDSSLLLLSWYGFEKAGSPRMRGTYCKIFEQLGTTNGLLYRYRRNPPEGTFAICSFWEAEYLAIGGGSLSQAHCLFRRLLCYANDLGLYAEEIDAKTGAALGNFPQAFTHVGLIGAALSILQREKGEQQLGHRSESSSQQNSLHEAAA